jgi:surfactin synthase thioesterase subunit
MPRSAKPYRLVPAEVPRLAGRGAGLYAEIVAEFVAADAKSVLVELPGRKANSLNVGLRKAVATSGAKVKVKMRGGQVYLQKA